MSDPLTLLNVCMHKTQQGRHQVFFKYAPHVQSVEVYALATGQEDYTMEPEVVYLGDQFYETWPRMVALIEKVKALK